MNSGLDYATMRYYRIQTGSFSSPDPLTGDSLRIVSPQRWNRYIYALNNPFAYVDPDGLDALIINYTDGALGLGHVGVMALNANGSGVYGGFNPTNSGRPLDRSKVIHQEFPAGTVTFSGGRPTEASLVRLRQALAKLDGHSPGAIRIRHIRTTPAETARLSKFISHSFTVPGIYAGVAHDCLDYCVRGLRDAGIVVPGASIVPNWYFDSWLLDQAIRDHERQNQPLVPSVTVTECLRDYTCPR